MSGSAADRRRERFSSLTQQDLEFPLVLRQGKIGLQLSNESAFSVGSGGLDYLLDPSMFQTVTGSRRRVIIKPSVLASAAPGPKGDQGDPGPPGADGADGVDGVDGADGADGAPGPPGADGADGAAGVQLSDVYPVGSIYIEITGVNPATTFGFGTWAAFGSGKVLVGVDSGDAAIDAAEKTTGAKTVASAGTVAAPTISGSTAAEATHTHSVTSNVTVADHAAHTHSVTSNVTVADHASHTHTYTDVVNHTHKLTAGTGTTGNFASMTAAVDTSAGGTGATPTATNVDTVTQNPTGGVATGTTAGPGAALTHTPTNNAVTSGNPSATLTHTPTNNAVTSGAGASHLHAAGTLAASAPAYTGSATSVVQPEIAVYFWKRTA
jgi:Collagen triple helix repeat (20 copies).